jgi:hypothetical protein
MKRTALLLLIAAAALPAAADGATALARRGAARARTGEGARQGQRRQDGSRADAGAQPSVRLAATAVGDDRRQAEALLARPDDTQADPSGTHKWDLGATVETPVCDTHFCIHYVSDTPDAPPMTDTSPPTAYPTTSPTC